MKNSDLPPLPQDSSSEVNSSDIKFEFLKVYLKDVSFEAPATPDVFLQKADQTRFQVDFRLEHRTIETHQDLVEVLLHVTVTCTQGEKTHYLCEVQQGGLFRIVHPDPEALEVALEVNCAHVLLPFIREEINHLVTKGGFSAFLLTPINFDLLYQRKLQENRNQDAPADPKESANHP